MADPGSGYGGPDAASQAAGAAAEAAASSASGFSGPASTGMSDNFGMHDDSFGQQEYGGPNNLGGSSQDHVQASFNAKNQISSKNPFGKQGFFSRVLGIDPNSIDYSNNMDLSTRLSIANNQFSKFANPQNTPGQLGYNPQYASAPVGQLRSGVQKAGYQTAYGPVMEQARQQGIGEMLARGAMGLFGGLPGLALGQIGTTEYGLPAQAGYQGLPGFDSFDPNNPRAGGGILGSMMLGGLNTSQAAEKAAQAVDSLRARFSPTLAPTTNAGIGSLTPASYETRADIRNRLSSTNPTMVSAPSSSLNARPQYDVSVPPSLSGKSLSEKRAAIEEMIKNNYGAIPAELQTNPVTPAYSSGITRTSPIGEQLLAGGLFDSLFRDPNISPEAREILKEKGMTIDDLFAPKTSTPDPEKPNIMDLLQGITQTSALGGPATANQLAQVDYSNLTNVGGNLYQARPKTSRLDSILESLGMKTSPSGPSGQIYSGAKKPQSLFDYIGFGQ